MYLKTLTPERQVSESGLRFLNSGLGRWTARDPIEERDGPNLFVFVRNGAPHAFDPVGAKAGDSLHALMEISDFFGFLETLIRHLAVVNPSYAARIRRALAVDGLPLGGLSHVHSSAELKGDAAGSLAALLIAKKIGDPREEEEDICEPCDDTAEKKNLDNTLDNLIDELNKLTPHPKLKTFIKILTELRKGTRKCESMKTANDACAKFAKDLVAEKCKACCEAVFAGADGGHFFCTGLCGKVFPD